MNTKIKLILYLTTILVIFEFTSCQKDLYEDLITENDTQGRTIIEDFSLKEKKALSNSELQISANRIKNITKKKHQSRMVFDSINKVVFEKVCKIGL